MLQSASQSIVGCSQQLIAVVVLYAIIIMLLLYGLKPLTCAALNKSFLSIVSYRMQLSSCCICMA